MCFDWPFSIVMVSPMAHPICDFRWDGRNSWRGRGTGPGVSGREDVIFCLALTRKKGVMTPKN